MPVIAYFFGIYIRMYHGDHPPAHIHVGADQWGQTRLIFGELRITALPGGQADVGRAGDVSETNRVRLD